MKAFNKYYCNYLTEILCHNKTIRNLYNLLWSELYVILLSIFKIV